MELHPFDVVGAMTESHDEAVGRLGGDLEIVGDGGPVDDQRVVPRGFQWVGEPLEDTRIPVLDERGLAVHDVGGPYHRSAEHFSDALMTEADPEERALSDGVADQVVADTGVGR